jgi:formylglycine-generating enzyme required for sulfatase activity
MSGTSMRARALILACATIAAAWPAARVAAARSAQPSLEARIANLKTKTAALLAAGLAHLNALSPQQRLAEPPAIWRVPGALAEFRDCGNCPRMVVIPAGEFTMGSPASEPFRGDEAQHRVTIARAFAVSKFEVTFDEWGACVKGDGCDGYRPDDQGWGRGRRPVIDMSWENAKAYASWLSRKTGKSYRLLSESEWEYAARAGTTTAYSFGAAITPRMANYAAGNDDAGPSAANRKKTLPVGSFPANAFGLHDMHGNVWEWVEDCWHDQYTSAAPTDGSPWVDGECDGRVVRGGSWMDSEVELRSAARTGEYKIESSYSDGIRVARDL